MSKKVTASKQNMNISTNISKSNSCKNLANPEENAEANPADIKQEIMWFKEEPYSDEEEKQTPLSPEKGRRSHIEVEYDEVEKEDTKVKDEVTIEKPTDNRPVLNNIRLMRTEGGALVVEIRSDKCAVTGPPDHQLRCPRNATASKQDPNISTNISKSTSSNNLANPLDEFTMKNSGNIITKNSEENAEANPVDIKQEIVEIKKEPYSEEEEEKQTPLSSEKGRRSQNKLEHDEVNIEDVKMKDVVKIEKLTDNRPDNWEPVLNNIRVMRTEGGALVVEIRSDKFADPGAPDHQLRCPRNANASKQDLNISTNISKSTSCNHLANSEDKFTMKNNGNIITKKSEENAEANPINIKQEIVEIKKEPFSEEEEEEKQTPLFPEKGRRLHNKLEYDEVNIEDVKVDAACGSDSSTDKIKTLSSLSHQTTFDMGTHMSQQARNLISSPRPMMLNSGMMNLMPEDQDGSKEGTLYGKCKREGIAFAHSNQTPPWSEDAMREALKAVRGSPLQIIGEIEIEHDYNHMEVDDENPTFDHVQKPRQIMGVRLNKAPKTAAERGREFRARKALLKQQRKQQQESDAKIATEDIRSAALSKSKKSAEATRRWREKKKGVSGSSKKQAKTAAQRMREYRKRKKLGKQM